VAQSVSMIAASVVLALVAAEPASLSGGATVLVSRRLSVSAEQAAGYALQVEKVMREQGVAVRETPDATARRLACLDQADPAACNGEAACVLALGEKLQAVAVVAVQVGALSQDVALHVEVVRVADGAKLGEKDLLITRSTDSTAMLRQELAALSKDVAPQIPAAVARGKEATASTAAPEVVTRVLPAAEPHPMKRYALLPVAAGVASAGVGAVFLFQAESHVAQSTRAEQVIDAARERDQAKELQSNGLVLVGAGAAAMAAGAAMYFFAPDAQVSAAITPAGAAVTAGGTF
jgi:hypothetical protein